ncbi:hypothetical protein V1264_006662 [Littorina saxatilis]|uniref:Glycosyltransferase family 92 protein n=1 Tax=Littorina saxatilis TaxID=31220 RepID=A0AAN9AYC5_9CAEN
MIRVVLRRCLQVTRTKLLTLCICVTIVCLLLFSLVPNTPYRDGRFYTFSPTTFKSSAAEGEGGREATGKPKLRFFKQVAGHDIFLYSAIANSREPEEGELNIIITAFDSTETDSLQCCAVMKGKTLFTAPATIFHKYYIEDILGPFLEKFKNSQTRAKQYACVVPELGIDVSHVTLTASSCPVREEEYLPVIFPKSVPQGLALCAKSAFGDGLDPNKLMEWFEVQRLLGVDHIQLMDLNNPEPVQKVFRYYKDMGLLNPLPYELPGPPYHRGLDQPHWVPQQASHDETFSILDCKQRLRGYSYVMGHDMDEVLMPAQHVSIKDLIKEQLMLRPDAAGFYFYTQFFIYDWGPINKKTDISYFGYLNSTLPRNECKKYVYLMSRVVQARTHSFFSRSPYQQYFIPMKDAILHHYRKCPAHVWKTCDPPKMTDRSMLRFQGQLEKGLEKARQAIGIRPTAS